MPRITEKVQGNLAATTNSGFTTVLTTGWILLYGATTLRTWLELLASTASFRARIRYRTADVTTSRPNAWVTSTTDRSTSAEIVEDFAVTAITDKLWIQVAVADATASTGQIGEASAVLQGMVDGNSAMVTAGTIQIEPVVNASQNAYYPLGGKFGALGLAGVMAGFVVNGVSGTLDYGLAIRYYDGDDLTPGAWVDLVNYTGVTANEFRNTGNQATTPGTKMFAQLGVKVPAGTNPVASIQVLGAARWT